MEREISPELENVMSALRRNKSRLNVYITALMSLLLVGLLSGWGAVEVYIAYQTKKPPDIWAMVAIISCPVIVIWQSLGVLSGERKDVLMALLGKTPQGSIIAAFLNSLRSEKPKEGVTKND